MNKLLQRKVLQAASKCFEKKGVRRTRWADLADMSGVPVADMKGMFKNKQILALAVQGYDLERLQMAYLKKVPDASLEEMIAYIIKTRLKFTEEHIEQTAMFFRNALAGKKPWDEKLTQMVWQLSIEFASLFEKAIREGYIAKSTDTNIAVRALTSFYLTGIVSGLREKDFKADTVWDFVEPQVQMFLNGLK